MAIAKFCKDHQSSNLHPHRHLLPLSNTSQSIMLRWSHAKTSIHDPSSSQESSTTPKSQAQSCNLTTRARFRGQLKCVNSLQKPVAYRVSITTGGATWISPTRGSVLHVLRLSIAYLDAQSYAKGRLAVFPGRSLSAFRIWRGRQHDFKGKGKSRHAPFIYTLIEATSHNQTY